MRWIDPWLAFYCLGSIYFLGCIITAVFIIVEDVELHSPMPLVVLLWPLILFMKED